MNKLSTEEQKRVVAGLVEGNSLRAVTRMTGVHRTTVMKLLCDLGRACFGISRQSVSQSEMQANPVRRNLELCLCEGEELSGPSKKPRALATLGRGLL